MKTRYVAMALTIASSLTVGCTTHAHSPEPVPLDRVECARCRMLISSENGSGEIVSSSEHTRFYDDVGCLAADWAVRPAGADAFVRMANGTWADARNASYAQPHDSRTAMGSGVVAFATITEARAADRDGRALTFEDVVHLAGGGI